MKELARRFMKTDWVQNKIKEPVIREILEEWTIDSLRRTLKPEGKQRFDEFFNDIRAGKRVALSDYIEMFLGYDFKSEIKGVENLEYLYDQPILVVANHTNMGPMRGEWQHATISYYVKQATGKEIRWLHGHDPTTTQDLLREKMHKSINSIPVRDPDPFRLARYLIPAIKNEDSMGLFPEGDGSKYLRKGLPEAGRLIALFSRKDINIISCSSMYQDETFFLTFDSLDKEKIKILQCNDTERDRVGEAIVDYAMAKTAKHLPSNRRGSYKKNFEEIISQFESPEIQLV
ncbi:MAG: hypothetical protein ACD_50C00344G0003 [uncultured bacterium]|nr:MAG: hypothetical protein ACD_50C00344G0003 [uncultured bacterium]OGH13251.1 MAG: hypothetical protein A2687_03865 [Candidatus Levybacteria bacterium RIFCSPHIGHO2_01_FULL_38_26]